MLVRQAAIIAFALSILSACSSASGPKGPKLVSYQDRQRATIEPAMTTGTFGSIADRLSNLAQDVYTGTDLTISETVLNDGKPSKGIRLTVKGSMVANGLIALPKQATISGAFAGAQPANKRPIEFYADNTGGWQASVPEVEYGSQVDINIVAQAVKGGDGDIQIFVYPMERSGTSSAIITHKYRVLAADDTSNEVQVPVDQ